MTTVPIFLERLGLRQDADERAIRRAYARELKQIDQEDDAAGFQNLRTAYETALQWLEWNKNRASEADSAEAHLPPTDKISIQEPFSDTSHTNVETPPIADSQGSPEFVDAAQEFELFITDFRQSIQNAPAVSTNAKPCRDALQQHLKSDRLININARAIFESEIAQLLAEGWKPGHEILLVAASEVFEWNESRSSLLSLGHAGQILEAVLHERALFDSQTTVLRNRQSYLVRRLRDSTEPTQKELVSYYELLEYMVDHFPRWLSVITDISQLSLWRSTFANLSDEVKKETVKVGDTFEKTPTQEKSGSSMPTWLIAFIIIALFNMVRSCGSDHDRSRSQTFPRSAEQSSTFAPQVQESRQPSIQYSKAPASAKELTMLSLKSPTTDVCKQIADMAVEYGIGTNRQTFDPGTAFLRQVSECARQNYWPQTAIHQPAVTWAISELRELQRAGFR